MKSTLTLIAVFCFSTFLQAQNWCPSGAKWTYTFWGSWSRGIAVFEYEKDTIINGQTCKKLINYEKNVLHGQPTNLNISDTTALFTYSENDSIFTYYDSSFLYTFPMYPVLNDTFSVNNLSYQENSGSYCNIESASFDYAVDSISNFIIDNDTLHLYKATFISDIPNPYISTPSFTFIERIGPLNAHLYFPFICRDDYPSYRLRCYEDDSTFVNFNLNNEDCVPLFFTNNNDTQRKQLSISPNPVIDMASIVSPIEISSISVVNMLGQTVVNFSIEHPVLTYNANVSQLPAGQYLFRVLTSNGEAISTPFVKE